MEMRFREINFDFQVWTLIRLVMYNGNIFYDKYEFPTTDLLRVTLVSVKEFWGIRISLNAMRSTQVFNGILYKNSHFIQRYNI